jgi:hypothetical protein
MLSPADAASAPKILTQDRSPTAQGGDGAPRSASIEQAIVFERSPRSLQSASTRLDPRGLSGDGVEIGAMGFAARLPLTPLARETTISILVNGKLEAIDVVCDPRNYGGDGQRFFLCPVCSRKIFHLYLRDERLACRRYDRITAALMSLKYGPSGRPNSGDALAPPDEPESRSADGWMKSDPNQWVSQG